MLLFSALYIASLLMYSPSSLCSVAYSSVDPGALLVISAVADPPEVGPRSRSLSLNTSVY